MSHFGPILGHFLDPFFDPFWAVLPRFCPLNPVYRGSQKGVILDPFLGHFWSFLDPLRGVQKVVILALFDIFEKEWFLGSFWTPLWNHPISDNYSKKAHLRVKRGHFRPPKVTKKGVQKVTPSGRPPHKGYPTNHTNSFRLPGREKMPFLALSPTAQKVLILAIFVIFVIFVIFCRSKSDSSPKTW